MSYEEKRLLPLAASGGISVPGTAAAATTLIALRMPRAVTIDGASIAIQTGGTAAGPNLILQKSLAGTGAGAGFATYAFGTIANDTYAAVTTTTTAFASGDVLLVVNAAGTAASTPKANLTLSYFEGI